MVFRGLILSRLHRALPGWLSVVLTALLFAVCHVQIAWMLYAFVLGLFFGFISLKAKSIWPSLCAHLLFNCIGQLSVYVPETDAAVNLFYLGLLGTGAVMCVVVFLFRLICPLKRRKAAAT
jgi:membrane protease YdiL (CAAX protease family)